MIITKEILEEFERMVIFDDDYYMGSWQMSTGLKWEDFKHQILSNQEKAEKWNKKIQFWIDEGLTKEEAKLIHNEIDSGFIKASHEISEENKQLKEDKEKVDKIQKRMDEINLDVDDTIDCHKIAKFVKDLLEETKERKNND